MIGPLAGLADDVFGLFARYSGGLFGKNAPEYEGRNGGTFGSPEFFRDAQAGDYRALARLEKEGYGPAWNRPFLRGTVEKEITRNMARGKTWMPKGVMTGSRMYGYGKFADNLWGKQARMGLTFGVPLTVLGVATAPKGEMIKRGAEGIGMLTGQAMGGAVGGLLFGMPGEIAGQIIGGTIGEKIGSTVAPLEELGHQAYHLNFGGEYHDTEIAWTMRQRAVQEMGSSAAQRTAIPGQGSSPDAPVEQEKDMSTTPYSLAQLSSMMDALTSRVTTLDGIGLPAGTQGQVPVLTARANGTDTKIRQVVTNLESQLTTLKNGISTFTTSVRQLLGLGVTS